LLFFIAPEVSIGRAAALDIVLNPIIAAGMIFCIAKIVRLMLKLIVIKYAVPMYKKYKVNNTNNKGIKFLNIIFKVPVC